MMETLHWIINTPGIGGLAVMSVVTTALIIYALSLLWLRRGIPEAAPTGAAANEDQATEDTERSEANET